MSIYTYPLLENRFPLATFLINIVGCLLIGVFYVLIIEKAVIAPEHRHLIMTGFLGAFTTFSTFSLDALNLWQNGHGLTAALYVILSLLTGLLAVWAAVNVTLKFV